jgi:hypothetical protein
MSEASEPTVEATTPVSREPVGPAPDAVDLPRGRSMQPGESMEISAARPTRFVVVAGAADSGKTTLLASLHERFLRGPWAGYLFAGCATFLGFERICHKGRGASGRQEPDTDRTKRSEGRQLLHLRVRTADCSRPAQDLLLSDLSGEEFDDARASADDARRLTIVQSAHHLVLLVDGEKLADHDSRQAARDETSLLLRTLVEERLVGHTSRVDLVFTKWDLVIAQQSREETEELADMILRDLSDRYAARVAQFRSFRVAARDPTGQLPPAHGLETAFPSWVEIGLYSPPVPKDIRVESVAAVEYDRFFRRQMPQLFRLAN